MQFRNTCIDGKSLKERKGMINTKFKMVLKSKGKRDDGKGENAIGEVNIGVVVQNYSFYSYSFVLTCVFMFDSFKKYKDTHQMGK